MRLSKLRQKRSVRVAAAAAAFMALVVGLRFWYLEEQGNFHAITPGEAYRSAQMDRDELEYYLGKYHIRSVINLRGRAAGQPWYEEEVKVCRELGVGHYDVVLKADELPPQEEIGYLIALFKHVPRPVLIHCRAGSDRSGLAAAIWKVVVDGASKQEAQRQLSLLYGHLPFGPTQVMDQFLDQWVVQTSAVVESKNRRDSCPPWECECLDF